MNAKNVGVKKYVHNDEYVAKAKRLKKEGKFVHPLIYKGDMGLVRGFYVYAALVNQFKKYKKYS